MSTQILRHFLAAILIASLWSAGASAAAFIAPTHTLLRDKAPGVELEQRAKTLSGGDDSNADLELLLKLASIREKNLIPDGGGAAVVWRETQGTFQLAKSWAPNRYLALGWFEGEIEQENEYYHDTDFALSRRGPQLSAAYGWAKGVALKMRLRDERFADNGNRGFYRLNGEQELLTGYLLAEYNADSWWLSLSHEREHNPDPIFDPVSGRGLLAVRAQELSGVNGGWDFTRLWELAGSIYYEHYQNDRPDQFNLNAQLRHRPALLPGLTLTLGSGYYTEERESIINLNAEYQRQLGTGAALRLGYQLEYALREATLLHEAEALTTIALRPNLNLIVRLIYGREDGGTPDSFFQAETGLEYRFF